MNIIVTTIPHSEQRYDTVGDWWFELTQYCLPMTGAKGPVAETLQIRVSDLGDKRYEWLVAEHEINEALMCQAKGISEEKISKFDKDFEALRGFAPTLIGDQEPGDMVSAPYHKQHKAATTIEKCSATFHEVDWKKYEKAVSNL